MRALSGNKLTLLILYFFHLQYLPLCLLLCLLCYIICNLSGYRSLQEQNQLPLRVFLTPIHDELKRSADTQNGIQGVAPFRPDCVLVDSMPTSNSKPTEALNGWDMSSRLLMERVKIFSDGSLGADTAALRVYSADSNETTLNINGSKGVFVYERSILSEMLVEAYEQGYRVEIHAIGDAAAERVLSALDDSENLLQQRSIHPIKVCDQNESMRELRHWRPILTHCQVLGADLVERMACKGIVANVQPSFVPTGRFAIVRTITVLFDILYLYVIYSCVDILFRYRR